MANRSGNPGNPGSAALLPTFKRYSKALDRLMMPVSRFIDGGMMDIAATELGVLVDGHLMITGMHDLSAVADYALHEIRIDGLNAIQRYLAKHPPDPGSQDGRVLEGIRTARFSVFLIDGVEEGIGAHVYDMLGGPPRFVFDSTLGDPGLLGQRFAGRILTVGEITLSTGLILGLDQLGADDILEDLLDRFPEHAIDDLHDLSPEDQAIVTGVVARAGIDSMDWILDQAVLAETGPDPLLALEPDEAEFAPLPLAVRAPMAGGVKPKKKKGKRR